MITEFFLFQFDESGLENMWFQQDGATAHTARATTEKITAKEHRVITFAPEVTKFLSCENSKPDLFRRNPTSVTHA